MGQFRSRNPLSSTGGGFAGPLAFAIVAITVLTLSRPAASADQPGPAKKDSPRHQAEICRVHAVG